MHTFEPLHMVNRKLEIVADQHRIAFHGKEFSLAAVDRIAYSSTRLRVNGSYMGTSFHLRIGQGPTWSQFMLDSGWKDGRLEDFTQFWARLVDLLEATACPRIADRLVASVVAGNDETFGGVVVGPAGVRAKRPLAKVVPWNDVMGTRFDGRGNIQVLVQAGRSAKVKPRFMAGTSQWNSVVLPRVIARFTG